MRVSVLAGVLCLAMVSVGIADPASAAIKKFTNIRPEPLGLALKTLAKERQLQVLFRAEVVHDVRTKGAVGEFTPEEALKQLLSGTGLSYRYLDPNTVTVISLAPAHSADAESTQQPNERENSKEVGKNSSQDFRMAQAAPGQNQGTASVEKPREQGAKRRPIQLEEVVVTGSRLPATAKYGPRDRAPDVKTYDRATIDRSGQNTLSGFLNTLPDISVSASEDGLRTTGATVQLHGLPIGTTLVLLNGQRVETSGVQQFGNYFDLNNIPLAAIERVEVVSEGSSAIYGSDAIAGVVNITMRKAFDGFEVNTRYGSANGTDEWNADLALGKKWERGSVSVVGSYQTRSELEGIERSITANNNYTQFGGPDTRTPVCPQANVFSTTSSNLPGLNSQFAAVPKGFTGPPSQQEFAATAGTLNECSLFAYQSLIPETHRAGLLAHATYDLTPSIELFSDVLYSRLKQFGRSFPPLLFGIPGFQSFTVSASNRFNPFGQDVGISAFLTNARTDGIQSTTFFRPSIGAKGRLNRDWYWQIDAWHSEDKTNVTNTNMIDATAVQAALDSSNSTSALNPFDDAPFASPQLLASLLFDDKSKFTGRNDAVTGFVRGPLLNFASGPVEIVLGGEFDANKLSARQQGASSDFSRSSYALFGETRLPIIGSHKRADAGDILDVTVAGRYDHYSDFGSRITPQFNVEFRPTSTLLLHGAYGKAFKAPSLFFLDRPVVSGVAVVNDPRGNNQLEAITVRSGGNPALQPETGQSRTIGITYNSNAIRALRLSATYWNIVESNSIQQLPLITLIDNEADFGDNIIRGPSQNRQPGPILVVNDGPVNFGKIDVAGIDYALSYRAHTSLGDVLPSLNITQTFRYLTALQPGLPASSRVSRANDDGNFAPEWKGVASIAWSSGPLSALISGRYFGRYQDYDSSRSIGNFWLFDANLRVDLEKLFWADGNQLSGAYITIGAVNLFDKLPQYSNFDGSFFGYDPAEADIRGRFVYVQVGLAL